MINQGQPENLPRGVIPANPANPRQNRGQPGVMPNAMDPAALAQNIPANPVNPEHVKMQELFRRFKCYTLLGLTASFLIYASLFTTLQPGYISAIRQALGLKYNEHYGSTISSSSERDTIIAGLSFLLILVPFCLFIVNMFSVCCCILPLCDCCWCCCGKLSDFTRVKLAMILFVLQIFIYCKTDLGFVDDWGNYLNKKNMFFNIMPYSQVAAAVVFFYLFGWAFPDWANEEDKNNVQVVQIVVHRNGQAPAQQAIAPQAFPAAAAAPAELTDDEFFALKVNGIAQGLMCDNTDLIRAVLTFIQKLWASNQRMHGVIRASSREKFWKKHMNAVVERLSGARPEPEMHA